MLNGGKEKNPLFLDLSKYGTSMFKRARAKK